MRSSFLVNENRGQKKQEREKKKIGILEPKLRYHDRENKGKENWVKESRGRANRL